MHEVKRITTIKKNQPLSSLGDLFTGMRYKTLQWAQTLVSRVTGLSSPPFPLYPLSLRAAAQPFPVPFVPSVSRPLGQHWPLCPLHSTVSQAHHRAATGSGAQQPQTDCTAHASTSTDCTLLARRNRITCLEKLHPPELSWREYIMLFLQSLHRIQNSEVEVYPSKLLDGMICTLQDANWIPPSSQH